MNNSKILIVEDETIVSMEIKRTVEKLGYWVSDVVSNYKDTFDSLQRNKPDLILMDINLNTHKDGIDIAQEINVTQDIPVVYLTADSDSKTIKRAIQTNPVGYLQKPFKREDLNSTIVLGLHKAQRKQKIDVTDRLTDIGKNYFYDLEYELLYYQQQPIKLSIKERALFTKLIQAKGEIISFQEVETLIWGKPISQGAFRTLLYRLRSKINPDLIETIPAFGIRLKI